MLLFLKKSCYALLFFLFSPGLMAEIHPARNLEVTTVSGAELPKLLEKPVKNYSLMAISNGSLAPIPYQFDDINVKGLPHVPGGKLAIKGKEGIFEAEDQLVFMYKDMSTKATIAQLKAADGQFISALEISEDGTQRYAYIFEGNPQRNDKRYAHYNFETGFVDAESYSMKIDPNNILAWEGLTIKGFTGTPSAPNVMDGMKARMTAKLGFFKATLHNSLLPINTVAVKNGPVRAIVESDLSLNMLGLDLMQAGLSTTFTAQSIEYPIFISFPKAGKALSAFNIAVTLDFVDLEGSRYRTGLGPETAIISGNKKSKKRLDEYTIDLEHPWTAMSTGKNWDLIFIYTNNKEFKPELEALYYDEKFGHDDNTPERIKGSNPEFGFSIGELPFGSDATLNFNGYFGPDLWQGNNPGESANRILNPAKVIVH